MKMGFFFFYRFSMYFISLFQKTTRNSNSLLDLKVQIFKKKTALKLLYLLRLRIQQMHLFYLRMRSSFKICFVYLSIKQIEVAM